MATEEGDKATVTVDGEKYPLQHPGTRWYIKHTDNCKDRFGNLVNEDYIDGLFEMICTKNVSMDDFRKLSNMQELVDEIEKFLGAE